MKQKLEALIIKASTRGYVRALKKDTELLAWVMNETSSLPSDTELAERVYCALHGTTAAFCVNGNHKIFNTLEKGFRFCASNCQCRREEQSRKITEKQAAVSVEERAKRTQKQKQTYIEKYGTDNLMQVESVREKIKKTNQERYGVDYAVMNDTVKAKTRKTNQERYGADTPLESQIVREKIADGYELKYGQRNNPMIEARAAFTKQHGCNPFQVEEIMDRARATMIEKYGVERALANTMIYETMRQHLQEKYGVDNVMELDSVRQTMAENNLSKYGRSYPNQTHYDEKTVHVLSDSEKFGELFSQSSLMEMSKTLGVSYGVVRRACHRFGFEIPRSSYEVAVYNFLCSHGIAIEQGNRSIIKPQELDIVGVDQKIAVELNGLYWHSDLHKDDNHYHLNKLERCLKEGWKLIQIFEDEWVEKREIVEKRLLHAFGKSEKGIGARKLNVRKITAKEAKDFLDANHIQGSVYGFAYYGALNDNELVAVMTFGNPRAALGRKSGFPELLRFATNGKSYPGVASKLFQMFIREYSPDGVITYADRRWSEGEFYQTLGFVFDGNSRPNYWYVHKNKFGREHRYNYRKSEIKDRVENGDNKTELEIMTELGYYRIWDCGHKKFVWKP